MAARFDFRILGPLEVWRDGIDVKVGGPRLRTLLALMLLNANRVVSRERLLEELGDGDGDRSGADRMLRVQVSRLRKALGPDGDDPRLVARPPGYLLRVEPSELDLDVFERALAAGQRALAEGDAERAADVIGEGLSLWRGSPLADLEFTSLARVEVERLEELRLTALEDRIDAELGLGRHTALVGELEALVAEHPLRERLRGQLMLALYRSGRQADALETYRRGRDSLQEQLGLDPAPEVQELERQILRHDAALTPPTRAEEPPARKRDDPRRLVCPFKGLATYEAADSAFFFGRERLVEELVAGLAETPAIWILGPSGSGKSSLVRAGLLPALAAGALPGSEHWRQVLIRPGEHPGTALVRSVGSSLDDALESCGQGERLVLAVDQFEEAFTACRDEAERRRFVEALVEASWDADRRAAIVLAMRADFVGELAAYPGLAELLASRQILLGPMSEAELRRAIAGPGERAGLSVEATLVDALVRDVAGQPGALPLLSSALLELWQERREQTLELASYERMGRVQGAVGRLAESAYARLAEDERPAARRILLRLVAGGDGDPLVRRRLALADLALDADEPTDRAVAALTDGRVLTVDDGSIELAHEALLDHWPRLQGWLEEDAEGRRLHRRLTAAATAWDEAGRDADELYRGARLAAALDWATQSADLLDSLEQEFLAESRAASGRAAERQRRANRRLRTLLAVALVLLAVAVAAGVVAFEQRTQARRDATAAEAERLGAQALIEPDLDRSLLLAREAVNLDDSPATRGALLAALLRAPAALAVVHRGDDRVLSQALSSDGRRLAFMTAAGDVAVVDTKTYRPIWRFAVSSQSSLCGALVLPLHALSFSPTGALAVGSTNGTTSELALLGPSGNERSVVVSPAELTADAAFSGDGRTLATGEVVSCAVHEPAEVIELREAPTGRMLQSSSPIAGGRLVGFLKGDHSVLVAATASSLLLDGRTLKPVRRLPVGGAAALSPTGNEAAFGHDDGRLTLVALPSGRQRTLPGRATGAIGTLSFSADGSLVTTASDDGTVSVWSTTSGLEERYRGHAAAAAAALFSPDGRTIYSSGEDGRVIAWDASGTRRLGRPFRFGSPDASPGSAVSPDGTILAVSPGRDRIALWQAAGPTPPRRDLSGPVGDVAAVRFSPDGKILAATGSRGTVLWDIASGRVVRSVPGLGGEPALAFAPRGDTLVIAQGDGSVVDLDLRTGAEVTGRSTGASVDALDVSPDGKLIASAALDGTATLWQTSGLDVLSQLSGAVADYSLGFSPDGKLVAVGDSSGTVTLWDVKTRTPVGRLRTGQNGGVLSLAFDRTGHELVTTGGGQVRLWDVASRKLIGAPLPGSPGGGNAVFFTDGKHILATFSSGTGTVWDVNPTDWGTFACRIAHRNLTPAEWKDLLPGRPYRPVCR